MLVAMVCKIVRGSRAEQAQVPSSIASSLSVEQ
jgi:hypothetical protein